MELTAELIESFAGIYLSPLYDEAKATPDFHREAWELYCSSAKMADVAAPRGHAKSTALTHDYILANVLFRAETYAILVSSNEEMAIEHLGDIANELRDNEALIRDFQIKRFVTDAKTDIIVEMLDGHQFRIIARGSGQKMRGRKWRGKRPGLIVCDDLEDDEQVESMDRRIKFRRWFFRALKPALRDGGKLRIHGTILHEDSLLSRLIKDKTWKSLFYRAHRSFDDFTDILWEESFPAERLRAIRQSFIEQGDAAGYSQEYLNDPFDNSDAYLRRDDFLAMRESDYESDKVIYAAADFAVSKKDRANRTSFTVGGMSTDNVLCVLDQYVGRWDTVEWMDVMFDIQAKYNPEVFFVEDGVIWKSIEPVIYPEMRRRGVFINVEKVPSVKDKATRGRSLRRRMRAGGVRFDKQSEWYPGYESELMRFTGLSDAVLDDQFDSTALLSIGFDRAPEVEKEDLMDEEELEFHWRKPPGQNVGRSAVTGY